MFSQSKLLKRTLLSSAVSVMLLQSPSALPHDYSGASLAALPALVSESLAAKIVDNTDAPDTAIDTTVQSDVHIEVDVVPTLEEEAELLRRFEGEGLGVNPRSGISRLATGDSGQLGRWEPLQDWPVIGVFTSLLPDGRVLSAGGGICGDCQLYGYLQKNGQVFTPPYLFRQDGSGELASRPVISSAPAELTHDSLFTVTTGQANSIAKVAMVRVGSVTH